MAWLRRECQPGEKVLQKQRESQCVDPVCVQKAEEASEVSHLVDATIQGTRRSAPACTRWQAKCMGKANRWYG